MPELPEARMARFISQYGLPAYDANLLTESRDMADYYESLVIAPPPNSRPRSWPTGWRGRRRVSSMPAVVIL